MSLVEGNILYDALSGTHLLLLKRDMMVDDDDIEKDIWWFREMEFGTDKWCWAHMLEDGFRIEVVA